MPNTLWLNKEKQYKSFFREFRNSLKIDQQNIEKFISSKCLFLPQEENKNILLNAFFKKNWSEECWRTSKVGDPLNKYERWHLRKLNQNLKSFNVSKSKFANIPNCFVFCIEHSSSNCCVYIIKGLFRIFCKKTIKCLKDNDVEIEYTTCSTNSGDFYNLKD